MAVTGVWVGAAGGCVGTTVGAGVGFGAFVGAAVGVEVNFGVLVGDGLVATGDVEVGADGEADEWWAAFL